MEAHFTKSYAHRPRGICVFILSVFLSVWTFNAAAQQNVPVTGFNSDQVANGAGAPSASTSAGTDGGADGVGYVFIDGTYQFNATCALPTTGILPANNLVPSAAVPGMNYELQPYGISNALRIPATGSAAGTGTLNVTSPVSAGALYLLSVSAGVISSGLTVTVTFTDLTTQVFSNRLTTSWCDQNSAAGFTKITTPQYNRVQAPSVTNCNLAGTCQYFAEMVLTIDPANYSKQVASIEINKTTAGAIMNVYAVGMAPPCVAPSAQPTGLIATVSGTGYIDASFSASSASGYLVVKYPQGATPVAPVTGTAYSAGQPLGTGTVIQASAATTFTASGLTPGTAYDFYVYAYNNACSPASSNPFYLSASPLSATLTTASCAGTLNGIISVGPGGTYSNITAALAAISNQGLSSAVILELLQGYNSITETFPMEFRKNPCAVAANTITIRPSSANSLPLTITSDSSATINFNGARYIIFDGRPGGTGSAKMLSIINTNNTGVAIRFSNDASYNTIRYCDVQGQNTSSTTSASSAQVGVISFGTADGTALNGNDSNLISYCDVHATSTGFPAIGIASYGNNAATPVSAWNDYNAIDHCNIFDFFSATQVTAAIKADGGSHRFTISNNHVYQAAPRTYTSGNTHRAFWLQPTATGASGFVVTNNFIGGADSLGNGTYAINGGNTGTGYRGIDINHAGTVHTSLQGNTITNMSITNTSLPGYVFRGFYNTNSGHIDIGTVTGNVIGSATVNGAISISNNVSGGTAIAINHNGSSSGDTVRIANNTIGGISIGSPAATIAQHIHGISVFNGFVTYIDNNTIGSTTLRNSIYTSNPVTSEAQSAYGILVLSSSYTAVTNNKVSNVTNNTASPSTTSDNSYTRGISLASSSISLVSGNTVHGIASGTTSSGANATSPLVGIAVNTASPSTITGNTVDSIVLMNNASANATNVDGMLIGLNGETPAHLVARNFVHHIIAQRSAPSNAIINGINLIGGANIVANNMIQLGLSTDGTSYDFAVVIRGLYMNNSGNSNLFHNSVYIGGSGVSTQVKNTFAFCRGGTSGNQQVRNNIFVNQRSNATTGGKHYQTFLAATAGLTMSNNVYYGTGTGSVFGTANNGASDVALLSSGWISEESNSFSANPHFIAPNGSSTGADLHINASVPTAIEGAGVATTVTDDYDGTLRSTSTPVDIGADAGNFTPVPMSIDSTVVTQVNAVTLVGAANQVILGVKLYAYGAINPLQLTALKLNTAGTSNVADIANARVYYTGSGSTFSTSVPFGNAIANPNGTFYVSGGQTLLAGVNNFWVVYDVSNTAGAGNLLDARLDSVGLTGNASANLLNGNPAGSRNIATPMSGNYNVGTGQTYLTITQALNDLNALGVNAPVTFTLTDPGYSAASGETLPILLKPYSGASPLNTVTFLPGAGITASITGSMASPLIRIDGGDYYCIDGRQVGLGTPNSIVVQNDDTIGGSAIDFVNDASFNVLRYAAFRAASFNSNIGVVNFGTGTLTGNDSNTLEYCLIGDAARLPATIIQAKGSTDAVSKFNNGNKIDHCELFNFFHATANCNALRISKGNTDWQITNNSIYQTVARKFPVVQYIFNWNRIVDYAGNADDAAGRASLNNMIATGNYIGGSAAQCGGPAWTQDSSAGNMCSYFNVGESGTSTFSRNTFANFAVTSMSTGSNSPGAWNAIQYTGGRMNIDSNVIGSLTDTASIRITAGNGAVIYPLSITGALGGSYSVKGNVIGGIRVGGRGPNAVSLYGIAVSNLGSGVTLNIDSNNIGLNGIVIQPSSATGTAQVIAGIANTSTAVMNLRKNTIHGLVNQHNAASGTSQAIGIRTTGGLNKITANVIRGLENQSGQTGNNASAATLGILFTSSSGNSAIERNRIYGLTASNASAAVTVTGIYYAGGSGDVVNGNLVHSLVTPSSGAAVQNGIQLNGGTVRVQNNMIRLGIDTMGVSQSNSPVITGLTMSGGNTRAFFNTIYVGGSGVLGAANTFALSRTGNGTDSVFNNIIVNERQGGTGVHYAVSMNGSANVKANNNLYYIGSGVFLGLFNNLGQATVSDWKAASGIDGVSNSGVPGLVNALGDLSTLDLHIGMNPTPVEGGGIPVAGIDTDFDGELRSGLTPSDLGADAGNFILSDIFPPVISFTPVVTDTVAGGLLLTGFASITDASTVDVGTNLPRIYYKKTTDANVFGGNSSFDNGWKYTPALNTTSPFSFVIDYSIINGGAVAVNDTIQYFIVAQDLMSNVGANPAAGFAASSVTSVTNAPSAPYIYRIKNNPLSGIYNIGAGQTAPHFTSLTAAIFALNDVGVAGPVTFTLTDPLYSVANGETFPLTIRPFTGSSVANTITVKPAGGITPVIAANAAAVFKLDGADNIIIDGSNSAGGTTRDLTLVDSNNTAALVWVASAGSGSGAENITVKNTNLAGNSATSTTCFGVYSAGQNLSNTQNGAHNHRLSVLNNKINRVGFGVYVNGGTNKHRKIDISNNLIGDSVTTANSIGNIAVYVLNADSVSVSGNTLLNIASSNTGSPVTSDGPEGITLEYGVTNAVVSNNLIERVAYTGSGGYGGKGITVNSDNVNSNIEIRNNMVSNIHGDGWSSWGDAIAGIRITGTNSGVRVYYNTVTLSPATSGGTLNNISAAFYASASTTNLTVKNNIFINPQFNSLWTSKAYAVVLAMSATTGYTIDNNNYFVSGAQGVLGSKGGSDIATLAAWQTATAQDAGSKNVNVTFVSARDLHLAGVSNGDFSLAGVPLAGITTDIDANTRHMTFPYMGADEASTPLPVELLAFTARGSKDDVVLSWVTASERNNKGFDVERSTDGLHFSKIGFVKGAGNSSSSTAYAKTDAEAFAKAGKTLYYRLKQVDLDGRFAYSPAVIVTAGNDRDEAQPVVYPNPFTNGFSAVFGARASESARLELTDLNGRVVWSERVMVKEGSNTIRVNDMAGLRQGLYILRITTADNSFIIKVNKQ